MNVDKKVLNAEMDFNIFKKVSALHIKLEGKGFPTVHR